MRYNRLGETGLLVSELSLGSWVTFDMSGEAGTISQGGSSKREEAARTAYSIMKRAYDGGVNFFDNAEGYANGDAERIMGDAVRIGIEEGAWDRQDLVLTTKIFSGADTRRGSKKVNRFGLSRKHVLEGLKASLERMGLSHVDVAFCHRPDPVTPMEEIVRAFNQAIDQGLCFYWATSEWSAVELLQAKAVADRLGLIPPCADQPEYSLLARGKVETEFDSLYRRGERGGMGLGLTIWSPLAGGVLTGKYRDGVPQGSRLDKADFKKRPDYRIFLERAKQAETLRPVAEKLGCTLGQLALAWCIANPHVSTVITGASDVSQVDEQLGALGVVDQITPEIKQEIDLAIGEAGVKVARRVPGGDGRPTRSEAQVVPMRLAGLSAGAKSKL